MISAHLEQRLTEIAKRQNRDLEALLTDYADQIEQLDLPILPHYFLEMASALLCIGDVEGNLLYVNPAFSYTLGYEHLELLGQAYREFIHPDDLASTDAAQSDLQAKRGVVQLTNRFRRKDGSYCWLSWASSVHGGYVYAVAIDIDQQKAAEQQLRHSEQLYRGLIDSQIDFVSRYRPDTTLIYVNDAYCRFFKRPREALIGQSFLALVPPEEQEEIHQRIHQVLQNPAPDVRTFFDYDANGQKRWVQWIDYGITDDNGNVIEIQAVGRDITTLIEIQNRLIVREDMLASIFDNIPVLLVQSDANGQFEYVNQHWIDVLGWTVEEMQQQPDMLALFYPDPQVRQDALDYMRSGELGWRDFKIYTRDGLAIDTTWANVMLADGRRVGIGQVITQRLELEQQRLYSAQLQLDLEKEQALREVKDRFVSLVAHEFRTPLAAMATLIHLVVYYFDRLPSERVLEKLADLQGQIRRMVALMEDALQFSKANAGRTDFNPERVELWPLCESVIETLKLTDDNQHDIVLTGDDGTAYADRKLLESVLNNLLSNALRYSPPHTTVALHTEKHPDHWQLSVQDQGIGIPESDLPKLFEPFYRASNATKLVGTGLGLSIVRDYVTLHGGDVRVASVVGKGTTFWVTLPLPSDS
ncbi:MAG: PAS domain S-box protein [Phototrophicaceae bacterium]